jgi:hypothetical protein
VTATQSTSTSKGPVHSGTQKKMRAGGVREVALVDFVEGLEPVRRDAQHIAFQHMLEVRPGGLQRLLHLLEDQLNLALERGVDEDLGGLRIEGARLT